MNRKRGTPPPKVCKRGHKDWRIRPATATRRRARFCHTCMREAAERWRIKQRALECERIAKMQQRIDYLEQRVRRCTCEGGRKQDVK